METRPTRLLGGTRSGKEIFLADKTSCDDPMLRRSGARNDALCGNKNQLPIATSGGRCTGSLESFGDAGLPETSGFR